MNKDILRQVAVVVGLVVTITANGLANALPLNGQMTGQISDYFDVYFTPAGYVFSIWGLIYLALIAYAVYQALPAQRTNPRLARTGWWFVLSCAANTGWIFAWHWNRYLLSFLLMIVVLLSLIRVYEGLEIGRFKASLGETWLAQVPFSIYLGWITVATVANVTAVLDYWNWSGWGISEEAWLSIMLVVALVVAALMTWRRRDTPYALVLAWAFAGIAIKHEMIAEVMIPAWVATGVALIFALAAQALTKGTQTAQ